MKDEDYNDLRGLFDENISLPSELSKDNMIKKISEKTQKKKSRVNLVAKLASAAAAVAIIICAVYGISGRLNTELAKSGSTQATQPATTNALSEAKQENTEPTYAPVDIDAEENQPLKFASDEDIEKHFLKQVKNRKYNDYVKGEPALTESAGAPAMPDAADNFASINSQRVNSEYSMTNTQVQGVDEADVVKTDGHYLYVVSGENRFSIVDTGTMKEVCSFKIKASKGKTLTVNDMYLNGNKLIVTGMETEAEAVEEEKTEEGVVYNVIRCYAYPINGTSVSILYDISNKTSPTELRRTEQSGYTVSSRMIGTVLYTVSRYTVDIRGKNEVKEKCVPKVDGQKLTHDDIYITNKSENTSIYTVVSAWDTADTASKIGKTAILGIGQEIYCTGKTLYVVCERFDEKSDSFERFADIYSFSLDKTKIEYKYCAAVPGSVDSQYSLDENNGFLRIATTDYDYNTDKDVSSLYVLDEKLNVIGKLEDIALDEQIKSVRFMGNIAYVVTFKNTDPLFAIDLSDPAKPTVLGKLKLPGFSEYLHPIGNGLLVGIGYSGDDENAKLNTVKVSLFDISDPKNPKELDSHVISDAYCDINSDPKAFMFYSEKNIIGIPLTYDNYDDDGMLNHVTRQFKLLKIENGKFTEKRNFVHSGSEYDGTLFFRGCFIGERLYTITQKRVTEHDMTSGEKLRSVDFPN